MRQLRLPTIINSDRVSAWLKIHHKQCSFFVNSSFQRIVGGPLGIPKTLSRVDKVKSIFIVILRDDLPFSLVDNFTDGAKQQTLLLLVP